MLNFLSQGKEPFNLRLRWEDVTSYAAENDAVVFIREFTQVNFSEAVQETFWERLSTRG